MKFDHPGYLPDDADESPDMHTYRDLTLALTCMTESYSHMRLQPDFPATDAAKFRRALATIKRLRNDAHQLALSVESQK